ncbi:MAG: TolB family protein [Candidatus Hodarchaeota archaeon]
MFAGLISDFCAEILITILFAIWAICRKIWTSLHKNIDIINWSPDGQKVCFVMYQKRKREIYVFDLISGKKINLTNSIADDFSPVWSPDGDRIAFVTERDGNKEIYMVNADGSKLKRLTFDPADDICPEWSPNGEKITYISRKNGDVKISEVEVEKFNN